MASPPAKRLREYASDVSEHVSSSVNVANTQPNSESNKVAKSSGRKSTAFEFEKHSVRKICFRVAYIGSSYVGFAAQPELEDTVSKEGSSEPSLLYRLKPCTVEGHILKALLTTRLIDSEPRDDCHEGNVEQNGVQHSSVSSFGMLLPLNAAGWEKSGRTDRGVSALGNAVSLRLRSNCWDASALGVVRVGETALAKGRDTAVTGDALCPWNDSLEINYLRTLNAVLPEDIRLTAWAPVDVEFSARFNARSRTYHYYFMRRTLDVERMRQAATLLAGEHDFRHMCKPDVVNVTNFVRTIERCDILQASFAVNAMEPPPLSPQSSLSRSSVSCSSNSKDAYVSGIDSDSDAVPVVFDREGAVPGADDPFSQSDLWCVRVQGSAFLWHQVRCIVAVLILIGRRLESPSIISELLDVERNPRKPSYSMASDLPLMLWDCNFSDEDVVWQTDAQSENRPAVGAERTMLLRHLWHLYEAKLTQLGLLGGMIGILDPSRSMRGQIRPGSWLDASDSIVLHEKSNKHKPLMQRAKQQTIQEQTAALHGTKRAKLERNAAKRAQNSKVASSAALAPSDESGDQRYL